MDQLPDSAIKIIKRTGIDGMSLGALNAPAWYGLVLFTNLLRLAIEDKVKPSQLDPSYGFTHTAGEGGIPNVADFFNPPFLLRGADGSPLIEYGPDLFKPQIFQYASGQFLKDVPLSDFQAELKGGQSAKDAIGGRIPAKKNTETVSFLRGIDSQIDVPSPNNVPSIKSVEELILWRIFMEQLTGKQPIIKVSTAYNFVARALLRELVQSSMLLADKMVVLVALLHRNLISEIILSWMAFLLYGHFARHLIHQVWIRPFIFQIIFTHPSI